MLHTAGSFCGRQYSRSREISGRVVRWPLSTISLGVSSVGLACYMSSSICRQEVEIISSKYIEVPAVFLVTTYFGRRMTTHVQFDAELCLLDLLSCQADMCECVCLPVFVSVVLTLFVFLQSIVVEGHKVP